MLDGTAVSNGITVFDGITSLVLPVGDALRLQTLYGDLLGFAPAGQADPHPAWQQLWDLPAAPTRILHLHKAGSSGGGITLAEVPGLPAAEPAGRPDRVGPYALDFYVRDADAVERRLSSGGWDFVSPTVHYRLPGTGLPVRERMLDQPSSGLLHALVGYRARGTRCVLDEDLAGDTSEVAAAVFVTDRLEQAVAFGTDVLGARCYFRGRFEGPELEQLLGLEPGGGLDAAMFRGAGSRNARLEFARSGSAGRLPDPVPRVVAGCEVPDLDLLRGRLDGHGRVTGLVTVDGRRHLGFVSAYGASFDFVESAGR